MKNKIIDIYTDGSCHTQLKIGAWAALVFINDEKITLSGIKKETTHNRMELIAVIESIKYSYKPFSDIKSLRIFTDSQYVERIPERLIKFKNTNFKTKAGKDIQNIDLVKELVHLYESVNIEFVKVKAHQKASTLPNYNRDVDKIARKLVREAILQLK